MGKGSYIGGSTIIHISRPPSPKTSPNLDKLLREAWRDQHAGAVQRQPMTAEEKAKRERHAAVLHFIKAVAESEIHGTCLPEPPHHIRAGIRKMGSIAQWIVASAHRKDLYEQHKRDLARKKSRKKRFANRINRRNGLETPPKERPLSPLPDSSVLLPQPEDPPPVETLQADRAASEAGEIVTASVGLDGAVDDAEAIEFAAEQAISHLASMGCDPTTFSSILQRDAKNRKKWVLRCTALRPTLGSALSR